MMHGVLRERAWRHWTGLHNQSDRMIAKREWVRALAARRQESGVGAIRVSCDTLASYRRGFSFPFSHGHQVISPVNTQSSTQPVPSIRFH